MCRWISYRGETTAFNATFQNLNSLFAQSFWALSVSAKDTFVGTAKQIVPKSWEDGSLAEKGARQTRSGYEIATEGLARNRPPEPYPDRSQPTWTNISPCCSDMPP